jgi:hypothetical protein
MGSIEGTAVANDMSCSLGSSRSATHSAVCSGLRQTRAPLLLGDAGIGEDTHFIHLRRLHTGSGRRRETPSNTEGPSSKLMRGCPGDLPFPEAGWSAATWLATLRVGQDHADCCWSPSWRVTQTSGVLQPYRRAAMVRNAQQRCSVSRASSASTGEKVIQGPQALLTSTARRVVPCCFLSGRCVREHWSEPQR